MSVEWTPILSTIVGGLLVIIGQRIQAWGQQGQEFQRKKRQQLEKLWKCLAEAQKDLHQKSVPDAVEKLQTIAFGPVGYAPLLPPGLGRCLRALANRSDALLPEKADEEELRREIEEALEVIRSAYERTLEPYLICRLKEFWEIVFRARDC